MGLSGRKRDRTARLLRLQVLLWQSPNGITINDMARKCSVSERTIFRDLIALETELKVPLWGEGNKRGVLEGYFLPPVTFTIHEAVNIYLATRMMLQNSQIYSPHIEATFMKINTIVPQPLKRHIQKSIEYLDSLPRNEVRNKNFEKLTDAWVSQHQARIVYQETGEGPVEHIIEPYFIEPTFLSRTSYVIAYDRMKETVGTFKTNQIIGDVIIMDETFKTPIDFSVKDFCDDVFGFYTGRELMTIKLRFGLKASKAVVSTVYHPSQKIDLQNDGSVIMTLQTRDAVNLRGWILRWGANVEVLEPESLRNEMIAIYNTLREMYRPQVKK